MQKAQPWLVRIYADDTKFAHLLNHITFAIIRDNSILYSRNMHDMIAIIQEGKKIIFGDNKSIKDTLCPTFLMWLKNICINNKKLYLNIFSFCFDKSTILSTKEERIQYIEGRLLNFGLIDNQIDDVYYILKGYIDSMYKVCDIAYKIIIQHLSPSKSKSEVFNDFEKYINSQEEIFEIRNIEDIAFIFLRDFTNGKNIKQ